MSKMDDFSISPEMKMQWPQCSWKEVTVLDIIDPSHFWVKESREVMAFCRLEKEINESLNENDPVVKYVPRKGDICCICWNNKWVRARVLLKLNSPSKGYVIKFFLVDWHGIVTISNINNIRACQDRWLGVPFQCVIASLPKVAPLKMNMSVSSDLSVATEMSNTWTESATTFVAKAVEAHTRAKLYIHSYGKNSLEVGLYLCTSQGETNFRNLLISRGYAISTDTTSCPQSSVDVKNQTSNVGSSTANKSNCDADPHVPSSTNCMKVVQKTPVASCKMDTNQKSISNYHHEVNNSTPPANCNEPSKEFKKIVENREKTFVKAHIQRINTPNHNAMLEKLKNFCDSKSKLEGSCSPPCDPDTTSDFLKFSESPASSSNESMNSPSSAYQNAYYSHKQQQGASKEVSNSNASNNTPVLKPDALESLKNLSLNSNQSPNPNPNVLLKFFAQHAPTSKSIRSNSNFSNNDSASSDDSISNSKSSCSYYGPDKGSNSKPQENVHNASICESDEYLHKNLSMRNTQNYMEDEAGRGYTWNAASFNTEMATSFKALNAHISGNVLSVGKRIPQPSAEVNNTKLNSSIVSEPSLIQQHVWPAIIRGRNVITVPLPSDGNMLIYLVPIISDLSDRTHYENIPNGVGPFALVLCPTSESAELVYKVSQKLIGNCKLPCKLLCPGNESAMKSSLINGCDLLIATPGSLLRMIQETEGKILNLSRLCSLIFHDGDNLTENFSEQITYIMREYRKEVIKPSRNTYYQVIVLSSTWNKALSDFVDGYLPGPSEVNSPFKQSIIYFSSFYEAAIFAKVHTIVNFVTQSGLQNKVANIFDECEGKKTIIFVSCNENALKLFNLAKSFSKNALRADGEMNISELKTVCNMWRNGSGKKMAPILICTDSALPDMDISDAQCIIHYDIPELSRTSFGLRYSTMKDWLAHGDSMVQDIRCVSFLLLTNRCMVQAPKLLNFVHRIKAEAPQQLLDLACLQRKEMEDAKISLPICSYVKAYGQCSFEKFFKKKCSYRHTLKSNEDKPAEIIPESGIITIFVTKIVSAVHYFAQIFHHEHNKGASSINTKYSKMADGLNKHYANAANQLAPQLSEVEEKQLYAICFEKTRYIRAKVLSVHKNMLIAKNTMRVDLHLVDDGVDHQCAVNELLHLPDKFQVLPPRAIEVFICNVVPRDKEINWSPIINNHVKESIIRTQLRGQIRLRIGNTVWLDPLVKQEKLDSMKLVINSMCVDKYLIEQGWAEKNEQHLHKLAKICNIVGISVPSVPSKTECKIVNDQPKEYSFGHLRKDEFPIVQVIYINSPSSFFVQDIKFTSCLTELAGEMKEWAESKKRHFLLNHEIGALCLAYFESDEAWCRAKILSITDDGTEVMYLDYGDIAIVPKDKLLRLNDEFCKLPFQAIECSLADVCVNSEGENWTDDHVHALADLTRARESEEMILLNVKVFGQENRVNKGNLYHVFLIFVSRLLPSVSIGQRLVDMNLAMPQNHHEAMKVCYEFDQGNESDISLNDEELEEVRALIELEKHKESMKKSYSCDLSNANANKISDSGKKMNLTPAVKWAQSEHKIYLSVKLTGVKAYELNMQNNSISFSCDLNDKCYYFELKFYGTIQASTTTDLNHHYQVDVRSREVNITIFKEDPISMWPRLLEEVCKPAFLGIDFERNGIDSEDSEDDIQLINTPRYRKALEEMHHENEKNDDGDSDASSDSFDFNN